MLSSEVPFSMGGRHSSTDSNKASSGDLSPYDNSSPVLSERSLLAMQEGAGPGAREKLNKGLEQDVLVGHLTSKSRESSPGPRLGKVRLFEHLLNTFSRKRKVPMATFLKAAPYDRGHAPFPKGTYPQIGFSGRGVPQNWTVVCRLFRGLSPRPPSCSTEPTVLCPASGTQCSGPRSEQAAPKSGQYLTLSSTEGLTESELDVTRQQSQAKPLPQRPRESARHDKRPRPPYPGPGKQAFTSSHQPTEPLLWRPQRPEVSGTALEEGSQTAEREHRAAQQKLSRAYASPASDQNSKTLGEPNWLDWPRERWQIWELLSADSPDALLETLV
ncbi:hypothetical protein MC885_021662 [Smutsia gigantea]|nr:hypothetical protein MC885_021662 [Smutsia gigantea]